MHGRRRSLNLRWARMSLADFFPSLWHLNYFSDLRLIPFIWLMTLLGAAWAFLREGYHREPKTLRGFLRFLLPPGMIGQRQIRLDIAFLIAKKLTRGAWGWAVVGHFAVAAVAYRGLMLLAPAATPLRHAPGIGEQALFVIGAVAAQDFTNFLGHILLHRIPALWVFHKVHHSVTFLTPISNYRIHPLQEVWDNLFISLGGGIAIALYAWLMALPFVDTTILGIQAYFLTDCLSFYHLRHSHIHLRYPHWLEHIFMSPAQHQIHHSCESRHIDRNFGLLLSCWDQLLGTIAYAEAKPVTRLGLTEDQEHYQSVWGFYAMPFVELGRKLSSPRPAPGATAARLRRSRLRPRFRKHRSAARARRPVRSFTRLPRAPNR
jgi:sterol desaturase/sphingolipid hydroxylase (fatty acid hydroxylase superfamily)